jgi:hypothetical protein
MNPWIEQAAVWSDFHNDFLVQIKHHLAPVLTPRYAVKVEARLQVQEQTGHMPRFFAQADVGLSIVGGGSRIVSATAVADAPCVTLELPNYEVIRETYLTITDSLRRRVVTVIELLSPSNKQPGPNRNLYLTKRREIFHSDTHLVEIDLLRAGPRMNEPELPASAYAVVVSRAAGFRRAEVWSVGLRERLPRIPVPLAGTDADVVVDLQQLLHEVYDSACYGGHIYLSPPEVPLVGADVEWAGALLAEHNIMAQF